MMSNYSYDPGIARILGFLIPGLGHLYFGVWLFAIPFFLINIITSIICLRNGFNIIPTIILVLNWVLSQFLLDGQIKKLNNDLTQDK